MEKTEAIILHVSKYGDNKLIVNTFTKDNGRMTFAVTIPSTQKKTSALPYCQALFINEIEYSGSNNAGIKTAKKVTPVKTYCTIPFQPSKTAVVMFLAEILSRVLSYSEENAVIFEYIATSLKILDLPNYKGRNFHLKFLLQLAKYLGFCPGNRYSQTKPSFDLEKSMFVEYKLTVPHLINPYYGQIFSQLLDTDIVNCEKIEINGNERSLLLEKIIEYYAFRFDNLHNIRSLNVLQTVFH